MFAAFTNLVRYQPGGRTDPGPGLAIWSVMYQSSAEPGYNERVVERIEVVKMNVSMAEEIFIQLSLSRKKF